MLDCCPAGNDLIRLGQTNHPRGNVILYSIGSERKPRIDDYELELMVGDMFLLCSDGLNKHVADDEMRQILEEHSPEEAVEKLIELANIRGGEDNITATVVQYGESPYLQTKPLVVSQDGQTTTTNGRIGLWLYTAFLTAVMIILMILLQAWLT